MLVYTWNLLATVMFAVAGLWGLTLARHNAVLVLVFTLSGLAALSWGFYPRRYARWRTVVGWSYLGLSLGILGGVAGQDRPFWLLALLVVLSGMLLLLLPSSFNGLFWTAALLRLRPQGWSGAAAQGREEVLSSSPFTLHEITKVTEQLEGGVVQQAERKVDRLECRYRGEAIESDKGLADLEDWVLTRYRQYRRLRRLPISPELSPAREVTREDDRPIDQFSSPQWASTGELTLLRALESSPFEVWVSFLGDSDSYRVRYNAETKDTDTAGSEECGTQALWREFETHFDRGYPCTSLSTAEVATYGWIVESATLRLKRTNRPVHTYPDLDAAEAEVWRRYHQGRTRQRNYTD